MRIILCDCSIIYSGRGNTWLGRGERMIIIKDDNTVLIHNNSGLKPLNYMKQALEIIEEDIDNNETQLIIKSKKEQLNIKIFNIISDNTINIKNDDAKMMHENTELQMHEKLSKKQNFQKIFGQDSKFLDFEFDTTHGNIDLVGVRNNTLLLIEMKRNAIKNDIYQVIRYRDGVQHLLNKLQKTNINTIETRNGKKIDINWLNNPETWLIANTFKPGVKKFAEKNNIKTTTIN